MNAADLASLLHARKVGKGRWQSQCPVHGDKNPSLSITEGRKVPVLLLCRSAGCKTEDILAALGLTWRDVMGEQAITPGHRVQMTMERQKEVLTEKYLAARLLADLEPRKRKYWQAVQRNSHADLVAVRLKLEPEEVYQEVRGKIWRMWSEKQREEYLERVFYREILPRYGSVTRL